MDSDIFEWNLADKGTTGAHTIDTITDFTYGISSSNNSGYGDPTTVNSLANVYNPFNLCTDAVDFLASLNLLGLKQ